MRKIIVLTPVKNESWILEKFILATSLWADKIIFAYQDSDDNTLKILNKYKDIVKIVKNKCDEFNEPERQKLLINEARKIKGNNIFIALDADEFLTLNKKSFLELKKIKELNRGTVVMFDWVNIKLDKFVYWMAPQKMPFGYVDNNDKHQGQIIHSIRVPMTNESQIYYAKHIKVMHYQYTDWARMESKHRWYQCWELIHNKTKNPIEIYRQYHHMYSIKEQNLHKIPNHWFSFYSSRHIDLKKVVIDNKYYWDKIVFLLFKKYGINYFKKLSIWDVNWNNLLSTSKIYDPRGMFDKVVHYYLKTTQIYSDKKIIKLTDYLLGVIY